MDVYLAGTGLWGIVGDEIKKSSPKILNSFWYCAADRAEEYIPYCGEFMLDSGAFTFCMDKKKAGDIEDYLERYADFIVRNKVDKFYELDIDALIGYDKVILLRKKLERLTGKQCIPVWHLNRGIDEFVRTCEEYSYVALGGFAGVKKGDAEKKYFQAFPWFIKKAHEHGARIHGLGMTSLKVLERCHFDSVDSSVWTCGNRYGCVYRFNGTEIEKVGIPAGKRIRDYRDLAKVNFREWVKFQKYAEGHL